MRDATKFLLQAFVRKGMTLLAGVLLARGILTGSEATGFVDAYLNEVVAAVLLLGSSLWTWGYQQYVRRKVVVALSLPPDAGTEKLAEVMGEKP